MGDENPRITLGDYGRLDNLDEVSLRIQPANPVVFDIKNNVVINQLEVSESYKCLRLIGYSLTIQAKDWLDTIPRGTITTWDQLKRELFDIYFPTAKYLAGKKEIFSFKQQEGEVHYDTWEMFKLLLKRCHGHKFLEMDIIQTFTTGLKSDTRMLSDASHEEPWKSRQLMMKGSWLTTSLNEYRAHIKEEAASKKKCMIDLNTHDVLLASNKLFSIQSETP